jgi:hypothetical protein
MPVYVEYGMSTYGVLLADEARAVFAGAGLGEPPIPQALDAHVQKIGKKHYATAEAPSFSPYRSREHLAARRRPDAPSSLVVAHAGHGGNSYAISYYLVLGSVRILLQLAWGGAYMNNGNAARRIRAVFETLQRFVPAIEARANQHPLGELYHSDFNRRDPHQPASERAIAKNLRQMLASTATPR